MRTSDHVVRNETLRIAAGEIILSAVMQLVFLLLGYRDITVLYGNILGAAAAVLNFYLMCITIVRAVALDEAAAKRRMRLSQMLRLLMLFGFALAAALLDCFNTLAALIPLIFPHITIMLYRLVHRDASDKPAETAPGGDSDEG